MLKLTTDEQLKNFVTGCCFFGTGGGGNADFGERMLRYVLDVGKEIRFVDSNEISNKDWIVCPYLMGTSGPESDEIKEEKIKHGLIIPKIGNMPAAATHLIMQTFGKKKSLTAIIPYEIGAAATASAVATAALLNLPTIDADFVGRSVPEATQMLPALYGVDLCPTAGSDAFGNETIINKAVNRHMIERIGKHIATASFGLIGQATLLRQAEELKKYMLPDTLSKAFAVGKALREANAANKSPEPILNTLIGSKKIFEGYILTFAGKNEKGYYVGDIYIKGENDFEGSTLKIWFKNENHIAWKDETVYMTSPDLISILDLKTFTPYVNNELKAGLNVVVYGTPAHPAWYETIALEANSPKYYGFNFDAVSVKNNKP